MLLAEQFDLAGLHREIDQVVIQFKHRDAMFQFDRHLKANTDHHMFVAYQHPPIMQIAGIRWNLSVPATSCYGR